MQKDTISMRNLIFLSLLFFNSCSEDIRIDNSLELQNKWILIQIENNSSNEIINNPHDNYPSIEFLDSNIVLGHGGCNTGRGTYTTLNSEITISCGFTKRFCGINEIAEWESMFITNLNLSKGYLIQGDTLNITTSGIRNLIFKIAE